MSRDVRLLAGATGLSALGDMLLWIPLAVHVQARTGSAVAVSALLVALWGPIVLLGGIAGLVADRVENRRLLILASLAQAAVVAGLAFSGSLAAILGLSVLLGAGAALAQPAEFALVPAAAGERGVAAANGRLEAARYLGMTAGPLLGGALAAAGLLRLALLLDAASFAAVAAAGLALRARREPHGAGHGERARAGLAFLARDRTLAITLGAAVGALALLTISASAELFFAIEVLHAGQLGYGALMAAWTLGMATGAVALARRVPAAWLAAAALAAVAVQGAGLAGAAAGDALWVAMAGFGVGGAAHGVKNVLLRTLIHERVPAALRGRAYAAYNAARNAAELGALGAGGALVGLIGARAALAVSGAVPAVIGVVALLALIRARRTPASDPVTTRSLHAYGES